MGRVEELEDIVDAVMAKMPEDETLIEIAANPKARHADRIAAAGEILDRGFGRPLAQLDVSVVMKRLGEMSDADLAALEARLITSQAPTVIDVEAETVN